MLFEAGAGVGTAGTDGFFACDSGVRIAEPGAALVVVVIAGRAVVVLRVDEESEARGAVRDAGPSTEGRVVRGRFTAAVVVEAAGRVVAGFAGDDLVAVLVANVVRRAVGFLFSSPDVTDDKSGSASDAVALWVRPAFLTTVPGAGRVGGLFKLDPVAGVRVVELESGFDAVEGARAVLVAAGRRAAPVPTTAVGRRGGTGSLELEAILRRAGEAGVVLARDLSWGASAADVVGSSLGASLAIGGGGGGESIAATSAPAPTLIILPI